MNSKESKLKAKEILSGCKNQLILATFVSLLIPALVSVLLTITGIATKSILVLLVVSLAMLIWQRGVVFSITKMYIAKKNGEEIETFGFLRDSINELKRAWSITFSMIPKFIVPILLYIVSMVLTIVGTVASFFSSNLGVSALIPIVSLILMIVICVISIRLSYQYRYADIEAICNPDLTSREVVNRTGEIMEGNRFKSFKLDLSFFLWAFVLGFLAGLVSGIIPILEPFATALVFAIVQVSLMMAHIVFYESLSGFASADVFPEYIRDKDVEPDPFKY